MSDTANSTPRARTEERTPAGIAVRVFIYLVAVHFIAAFFFLIFYLGGDA
ncbi:DUF6126 family protein [Streptomyces orinoci]|uniref:DUF6126 family protein n=1 Tax=Streptomyces orinoci TaxID=67339 RepID=A0ABV3JZH0_STRON|nr:DUF6126 family protein [Streptomyces orinoci]